MAEGPVRAFTVGAAEPVPQPRFAKPPAGYPMVALPRGAFLREDGKEIPVGPFQMGRFEVSQTEFDRVMGRNPSYRIQDSLPVERITWEEADAYCREIGGRLPTEAEWEYAARAGSHGPILLGTRTNAAEYAWFRDNSEDRTQKVGLKKPNAWGLHDMAGNVFEWVQDWYGEYSPEGPIIPADRRRGPPRSSGAPAGTAKAETWAWARATATAPPSGTSRWASAAPRMRIRARPAGRTGAGMDREAGSHSLRAACRNPIRDRDAGDGRSGRRTRFRQSFPPPPLAEFRLSIRPGRRNVTVIASGTRLGAGMAFRI